MRGSTRSRASAPVMRGGSGGMLASGSESVLVSGASGPASVWRSVGAGWAEDGGSLGRVGGVGGRSRATIEGWRREMGESGGEGVAGVEGWWVGEEKLGCWSIVVVV